MKIKFTLILNNSVIIGFNLENPAMTDLIIGRLGVNILSWGTRQTQLASKHIGVTRSEDSVFVNQFENLFIGLNENGEVVMRRLTKTSFREIEYLLKEFKDRLSARKDGGR